ncbi:MAG: hypothetical protein NTW19_06950 [Planctomycetota bacterium]|nr:hypothetical protein [Planctomycetota bacterium]
MVSTLGALRGRLTTFFLVAAVVGAGAAIFEASVVADGYRRFMMAYVVAFAYVLSIGLGGLFFVLLQHLVRAGWSVQVRRVPEAVAASLPIMILLFIPIAFTVLNGKGEVFPWARPVSAAAHHVEKPVPLLAPEGEAGEEHADAHADVHADTHGETAKVDANAGTEEPKVDIHAIAAAETPEHQHLDQLTLKKRIWLNPNVFIIRWVVVFAFWTAVGAWYYRTSGKQDHDGDHRHTIHMETASAPLMVAFAFSISVAAWDLLMSVNPHWYSTMFGVYYFAGAVIANFAFTILWIIGLSSAGALPKTVTVEHRHDLGRFLFGFVFFWGYIAFSQYMLIWYASLPEETIWFKMRGATTVPGHASDWCYVAIALIFCHFIIPFLGLLSRHVKRNKNALCFFAVWMLVVHAVDMIWVVMPEMGPGLKIGAVEIGLIVALLGVFCATVTTLLARHNLVPMQDPRLDESLALEGLY